MTPWKFEKQNKSIKRNEPDLILTSSWFNQTAGDFHFLSNVIYFIKNLIHCNRYVQVLPCSLVFNDLSIFLCAYVLPIFLSGEIFSILFKYFQFFWLFTYWLVCFIVGFWAFLTYSCSSPLAEICFANIFSEAYI